LAAVKEDSGYFSDGLLNFFHFGKDLTARRKNPARGLGGETTISPFGFGATTTPAHGATADKIF
jgi:hypothetical protein